MPRVNSFLCLLRSNAIQVVPRTHKAVAVLPKKPADALVVHLEYKHFAGAFVPAYAPAPLYAPAQATERLDMPRPDALAIALLEQYPNHS